MKISMLQPEIKRGDIVYNTIKIQALIHKSQGDVLILPEYVLTGSLVLDENADIRNWAKKSQKARSQLQIPDSKTVLLDMLVERDGHIYNDCELLLSEESQVKVFLDVMEKEKGIIAGDGFEIFERKGNKFKIAICTDFRYHESINKGNIDFLVWVTHFNETNFERAVSEMKRFSIREGIPVMASSPVSDMNIGKSTYVNGGNVISLSSCEGILEITLIS